MSEHPAAEIDPPVEQRFNTCPRCGRPVPAPFEAHVDDLGGRPPCPCRAHADEEADCTCDCPLCAHVGDVSDDGWGAR